MNKSELKALYEKHPWAWDVEVRSHNDPEGEWTPNEMDQWFNALDYRLKPKLPAGLLELGSYMYNRAVYLRRGPIKLPAGVAGFRGWALRGFWEHGTCWAGIYIETPYCIDINDPNADEIIELNRERRSIASVGGSGSVSLDGISAEEVDALIRVLSDALIGRGWTPPGESKWLRLDECEIQYRSTFSDRWLTVDFSGKIEELQGFTKALSAGGLSSVRVRKKQ